LGPLSRQVQPDVAIITTIEPAHIEFFSSVEAIADAKAEIFEGMGPGGVAVLNRDNPQYGRLLAAARTRGLPRIVTFGAHDEADARLADLALHATCSSVITTIKGEPLQYTLSLPGRHWAMNSLAVLLAVAQSGGDMAAAARAMAHIKPPKGRGVRKLVQSARGAFTLIDESYNASPVSMEAALAVLGKVDPGAGGRRIAVLGDMRELGSQANAFHEGLAAPLQRHGIDLVFCAGPHMRRLFDTLPARLKGGHAETAQELAPCVVQAVKSGDVVMVKGSAGSRTALVVEALAAMDQKSTDQHPAAVAAGRK
ncbi:MAG TPA: Mur ligase family protein, partial [Azospirillaceae bacterium]|nr:Mur ligase family protein [Azospirillaceae bacterium]